MKVFIEEQRFTQWWIYTILLLPIPISLIKTNLSTKNTELTDSLVFSFITLLLVIVLFFMLKLKTRIDEKGIQYRFFPFHFSNKLITWNEIENVNVRKYNAITEYGGWGLKGGVLWNKNKGVAYNVKGNMGIQLILKNGKKILIGTQKENDIRRIIQTYNNKIRNHEN